MSRVRSGFDRYSGDYQRLIDDSIAFGGAEHGVYLEAKAEALDELVRRRLGSPGTMRLLDVGCGLGLMHPYLDRFGDVSGVDPSAATIERARKEHPGIHYTVADGSELPFEADEFDVTTAVAVFHHVPPDQRAAVAAELGRVTRPGGLVVIFEHNPLNPLTRLVVARCAFDEDAILLPRRQTAALLGQAAVPVVESRYILFSPWRGTLVRRAERGLHRVPVGAQYYVAGIPRGSPTMRPA